MGFGRRVAAVAIVVLAIAGAWWWFTRPRIYEVTFADLPVLTGRFGLQEPLAAEAWPPCDPESADFRAEIGKNRVSVTIRPHEDVQCALPWAPPSWWMVGDGRVEASRGTSDDFPEPLLLMGAAGASGGTAIRLRCPVEEPVTLFIELNGGAVELGSLDDPGCGSRGPRAGRVSFHYRPGGLETPAGWLDATIDAPSSVSGDVLHFVLEMTNDTPDDIPIGRCPFFEVRFVAGSDQVTKRSYLNCPAAPDVVGPGDVVRFAIELPLEGVAGAGHLELELRDENRVLHRIESDHIEVAA